jgi:hypothetical protein
MLRLQLPVFSTGVKVCKDCVCHRGTRSAAYARSKHWKKLLRQRTREVDGEVLIVTGG